MKSSNSSQNFSISPRAALEVEQRQPIRILLADDHPIYRKGLEAIFELDDLIEVVGTASDGHALLELAARVEADVVILDVEMKPMDGFTALCKLRDINLELKTIFLTLHKDAELVRKAVALGINGFLLKDADAREVIAAVKAVSAGLDYLSPSVSSLLMQSVKAGAKFEHSNPKLASLTRTELIVFNQIATDKTSKEIAADLNLSPRTVENHRARICKKLDLSGAHSLVKFAFEHKIHLSC